MKNQSGKQLGTTRQVLVLSLVLCLYTLIVQFPQYYGMGSLLGKLSGSRLLQISPVLIVAILDILFLVLMGSRYGSALIKVMKGGLSFLRKIKYFDWMAFIALILLFPFFVLSPYYPDFGWMLTRLWIYGHGALLGALFLHAALPKSNAIITLVFSMLFFAVVERIALYIPEVNDQMISLGWSEASRYYYASLYFARSIYGEAVPLSSLHPSRYLLQAIPFFIHGLPIWVHRAWQVFLWLALTFAGSITLARRLPKQFTPMVAAAIVFWGYLFLNQGPVYYHLMVCVILIFAGFSSKRPVKSLLFVILASLWAGISRINWFPVPGFLAAFLFALEEPRTGRRFWRYWLWPLIWIGAGMATALLSQSVFIAVSGNPVENFSSSFSSSLLWYRLLPNITYPQGVLPAILVASIPGIVLIVIHLVKHGHVIHWERMAFLVAVLLVFFGGGIVVSVKIGGGSNLHNLDAFLVFLMVMILYLYFNSLHLESQQRISRIPWYLTALLVFIPVIGVVQMDSEYVPIDNTPARQEIQMLQQYIDNVPGDGGEILFITQRHFLTFGYIRGVHLVPGYEKVFMMEMAMAGNQDYFQQFEKELQEHRFALIITEPLSYTIQGEQDIFAEENNAWTTNVVTLIRRYYHDTIFLPAAAISIAVPNTP